MTETPRFIDSHAHIDGADFATYRAEVLERARAAGIEEIIVIGVGRSIDSIRAAAEFASAHPGLRATVGIHPHDVAAANESWWPVLDELAGRPVVCGIGETGLDYYYDRAPRSLQRELFERSIELARRRDKALVCHIRDAHADAKAILRASAQGVRTVIHCFTGSTQDAAEYIEMGCHISVSGIITFRNAVELRRALHVIPGNRLLLETDCPYLAPVPMRGKRNEPAFLRHTAEAVAQELNLDLAELAAQTTKNTRELFALT